MNTLLLCGYRAEPLGLEKDLQTGLSLLEWQIQALRRHQHHVICVVTGQHADELLRHAPTLQHCELVFDDNQQNANLISNTREGLKALDNQSTFVLPIEIPYPQHGVWHRLQNEYGRIGFATKYDVLQLEATFPLLVTRHGRETILSTPDLTDFLDQRLSYLHLEASLQADVAPGANP